MENRLEGGVPRVLLEHVVVLDCLQGRGWMTSLQKSPIENRFIKKSHAHRYNMNRSMRCWTSHTPLLSNCSLVGSVAPLDGIVCYILISSFGWSLCASNSSVSSHYHSILLYSLLSVLLGAVLFALSLLPTRSIYILEESILALHFLNSTWEDHNKHSYRLS